jgi:class 3 adenylate cyclase/tetratricopeptide (TPR) repeat protein
MERKLAAIMYADVAGYSRLTGVDEEGTHRTLGTYLDAITALIEADGGRVLHYAGDAILAEFASVVVAVKCAVAVQSDLCTRNADLPNDRKILFRIGINLGDVIVDRGELYGDGVNVAARLEGMADPAGICVSGSVYDQVAGKIPQVFEFMGEQMLKNIERPVRAYRIHTDHRSSSAPTKTHASPALEFEPPDRPSVAILPFKSLGSDADKDYIADGIRFGISASLVQLSGLFLVHSPALNAYRGKDVSASSVGRELDARYVLEGAVQQVGNRVRVTVQLTDVDVKQTILADRYDRVLEDVFELQDEITREVISSLNITLVANEIDRIWFGKLSSPEAKEYYYRGASHFYELNKDDNETARNFFEELYRVQPDSVIGPSYISVTHWLDAFFDWTDSSAGSIELAATWAQKAMQYEDNNGIGHAVFGHLQLLEGNYDEALENCSTGVKLRSSCPLAHGLLGLVLNYCGDAGAAVKSVREALQLEKVYPTWLIDVLAAAYRDSGNIELSIPAAKESLRLNPQNNEARLILCSDYQLVADHDQARRLAGEIMAIDPEFHVSTYAKSQPYRNPATLRRLMATLCEAGLPQ